MKKTFILTLCIFALNAFAYSQTKIGVINSQEIVSKSKRGVRIQKRLENLQKTKQSEIQVMENELRRLKKELDSPGLNRDTREQKSKEYVRKGTEFKRFYQDAQREIDKETKRELAALESALLPLIKNYGRFRAFAIIHDLERSGIVYFDNAIDITADIIKEVDARFP